MWSLGGLRDPEVVRDTARRILSEPPFPEQRPSAVEQLVERAGAFLGELLGRLIEAMSGDTTVAWLIVVLGTGLLILAVWRWTRGARVSSDAPPAVGDTGGWTAAQWLEASRRAAAAGDLERALRQRYLALVANLVERDVLQDLPGRTIREIDRELAAAWPDAAAAIASAGARVERVVYAGAGASSEDLEVLDAALDRVGARVRTPA